jgi:hypothetical protein
LSCLLDQFTERIAEPAGHDSVCLNLRQHHAPGFPDVVADAARRDRLPSHKNQDQPTQHIVELKLFDRVEKLQSMFVRAAVTIIAMAGTAAKDFRSINQK